MVNASHYFPVALAILLPLPMVAPPVSRAADAAVTVAPGAILAQPQTAVLLLTGAPGEPGRAVRANLETRLTLGSPLLLANPAAADAVLEQNGANAADLDAADVPTVAAWFGCETVLLVRVTQWDAPENGDASLAVSLDAYAADGTPRVQASASRTGAVRAAGGQIDPVRLFTVAGEVAETLATALVAPNRIDPAVAAPAIGSATHGHAAGDFIEHNETLRVEARGTPQMKAFVHLGLPAEAIAMNEPESGSYVALLPVPPSLREQTVRATVVLCAVGGGVVSKTIDEPVRLSPSR